jgi:biotin carboxyl carrier protein
MSTRITLGVQRDGPRVRLTSPAVGQFTGAVERGRALTGGEVAGTLLTLGRALTLVVPDDVAGMIESAAPERVHEPVGFGSVLYELAPLDASRATASSTPATKSAGGALVFRSPQTGRFWHRASPAEPALAAEGKLIEPGVAIGLIEVMKTFTIVNYVPSGDLPRKARIVRVLAADGAEVAERDALIELAPE